MFVAALIGALPRQLRDGHRDAPARGRRAAQGDARRRRRSSARICARRSARSRGGIDYEFVGEVDPGAEVERALASEPLDEIVVADAGLDEPRLLEIVEAAHRRGVKVRVAPRTTELLVERGEYVPGPGRAAVRAAAADVRRRASGRRSARSTSLVGSLIVVVGLPLWLLLALLIKLSSRGLGASTPTARIGLGEQPFEMLKFRTMVAGAAEEQAALERENEACGRALQDPRRPARDAGRPRSCAGSRSTRSRT